LLVAGCFVCFPRSYTGAGEPGDPAWAAVALFEGRRRIEAGVRAGRAGWAYHEGLLALREGELLEGAVRHLTRRPDVLLVNATGRDHPRRAGLALHLGAVLDLPTVGATHRPLLATGEEPADVTGATSPLWYGDDEVGRWLRTRAGTRPIAVHAAWRTDAEIAAQVVGGLRSPHRTPRPLREARRLARQARAVSPAT
jgi:deoxyribonuclease V